MQLERSRWFFRRRRKVATDETFRMEAGRRFHDLAAAAGNERSPTVDRRVGGTVSNRVSAERR